MAFASSGETIQYTLTKALNYPRETIQQSRQHEYFVRLRNPR